MAASTPSRRTGCSVISQASSGVRHDARKSCCARSARYSGRYRPACRMIQTGVRSTGSRRQARRKSGSVAAAGDVASPRARFRRQARATSSAASAAATIVSDVGRRVCGREEVGLELRRGQQDPAREHGLEVAAEARRVGGRCAAPVVHARSREEQRPHRPDAGDHGRHAAPRDRGVEPVFEGAAEALEPLVETRIAGDGVERREARRHGERVARQRPGLVHRAGRRDALHQVARGRRRRRPAARRR